MLLVTAFTGTIRTTAFIILFKITIGSDQTHEGQNSVLVLNQMTQRKLAEYLPFNQERPFDEFNNSSF